MFISLKFAEFDRVLIFKCPLYSKSRIDGYHSFVKTNTGLLNAEDVGLDIESLAEGLNYLEMRWFRETRQKRDRDYLHRYITVIPDDIKKFETENQPKTIKMNISDAVATFYSKNDDTLYISFTRCNCDRCLTESFLKCMNYNYHVLKFDMSGIK